MAHDLPPSFFSMACEISLASRGLPVLASNGQPEAVRSGERGFRVFDGFCKAGGAGEGYARAGADVVSMDIEPQPRNPHTFARGDVLKVEVEYLRTFDLLHFSPPCQGYTEMRHAPGAKGTAPLLIKPVRALAKASGVPYVIENVEDAAWDMIDPVTLCGSMFDLRAHGGWLQRHRLFECSFPVARPECRHDRSTPVIGVYGGHVRIRSKRHGGRGTRESWVSIPHKHIAADLMGIDWMEQPELDEAIPPAFTQYVAERFLAQRERVAA